MTVRISIFRQFFTSDGSSVSTLVSDRTAQPAQLRSPLEQVYGAPVRIQLPWLRYDVLHNCCTEHHKWAGWWIWSEWCDTGENLVHTPSSSVKLTVSWLFRLLIGHRNALVADATDLFDSSDSAWQSLVIANFSVASFFLILFGACFALSVMVLLQSERYAANLTSKTKQLKRDKRT